MLITLKNDMFGCFRERGERGDGNETSLKEGGGTEMSNYSAFPYTRMHRSLSLLNYTYYVRYLFGQGRYR